MSESRFSDDEIMTAMQKLRHIWRGFFCDNETGDCLDSPDTVYETAFIDGVGWAEGRLQEIAAGPEPVSDREVKK